MNYDHLAVTFPGAFGSCLIIPLFVKKVKKLTKGLFVVCNNNNNNNNNLNIFMQDCCFSFKKKTAINAGPVKILKMKK